MKKKDIRSFLKSLKNYGIKKQTEWIDTKTGRRFNTSAEYLKHLNDTANQDHY